MRGIRGRPAVVGAVRALAGALGAAGAIASASALAEAGGPPPAYCPLATAAAIHWAFRTGVPITKSSGSFARGNGSLAGARATGAACQVDRARDVDRQIELGVTRAPASLARGIVVDGVLGAQLTVPVKVASTTDAACRVGTDGALTIFSSYNGAGKDSVALSFAKPCRGHDHRYASASVHVSIPH